MTALNPSILSTALALLLAGPVLCAQAPKIAPKIAPDFARAAGFKARTEHKVHHGDVRPQWLPDGSAFLYRDDLPGEARTWMCMQVPDRKSVV